MTAFKIILIVLITMVALASAAAQEIKPVPPQVPGLVEVIASEKLDAATYTNGFLGLRLAIPEGWQVSEDATKKKMMEAGKEYLKPTDEAQRADMEKSMANSAVLLTLLAPDPVGTHQSSLIVVIEKLPAPDIRATPYVTHLKEMLLENSTLNYAVEKDVHDETLNGQPFAALDVFIAKPDSRVNQKYACQMRKGYALCIVETYHTEAQLAALASVAKGLTLK
jgi:hypothetical protein